MGPCDIRTINPTPEGAALPINWSAKSYSKDEFIEAWKSSTSISQVLEKLGYAQGGGSYGTIRKAAEELQLDSSHMLGQGHMKGKVAANAKPLSELLVKGSKAGKLKNRLFKEGIFERKCSVCSIVEWNGKPTPLELDHIDGDNRNNELQNLRIICPNCHAQTDTYKGKNIAKRKLPTAKKQSNSLPVFCLDCSKEISNKGAVRCVSCSGSNHSKIEWPDLAELQAAVADYGYSQVGRNLGVSDNAIRKRIVRLSDLVLAVNS